MAKTKNLTSDTEGKIPQEAIQTGPTLQEAHIPAAPDGSEQKTPEAAKEAQVTVCVNYKSGLNLREGPHRGYKSLTVIPDGEALEVLCLPEGTEVPGWALVRCGEAGAGLVGWVNTDYVREN